MNGLTAEDVIELRDWNNKREDTTMSGRINGVCAIALAALSSDSEAPQGMPVEPECVGNARLLNTMTEWLSYTDALRTFALREHQGRIAAEGQRDDARLSANRWAECSEQEHARANAAESRAADLERAHADCRKMLEGEHDAHMECHARADAAEAEGRRKGLEEAINACCANEGADLLTMVLAIRALTDAGKEGERG